MSKSKPADLTKVKATYFECTYVECSPEEAEVFVLGVGPVRNYRRTVVVDVAP